MHRRLRFTCVAGLVLALVARPAHAELSVSDVKNLLIERAIAHKISPSMILCLVARENKSFDPSARGSLGEYGLAQWLPGHANAWSFTLAASQGISVYREYDRGNPDAAYYDADGLADLLSRGRAYRHKHWPITIIGCE